MCLSLAFPRRVGPGKPLLIVPFVIVCVFDPLAVYQLSRSLPVVANRPADRLGGHCSVNISLPQELLKRGDVSFVFPTVVGGSAVRRYDQTKQVLTHDDSPPSSTHFS